MRNPRQHISRQWRIKRQNRRQRHSPPGWLNESTALPRKTRMKKTVSLLLTALASLPVVANAFPIAAQTRTMRSRTHAKPPASSSRLHDLRSCGPVSCLIDALPAVQTPRRTAFFDPMPGAFAAPRWAKGPIRGGRHLPLVAGKPSPVYCISDLTFLFDGLARILLSDDAVTAAEGTPASRCPGLRPPPAGWQSATAGSAGGHWPLAITPGDRLIRLIHRRTEWHS